MSAPVLVCTVGGSPAPIVTAILTGKPAHVVFIASEDVAKADGGVQPGSIRSLDGPDGILAKAGLGDNWESVVVPPDQPDVASAAITDALRMLSSRFADAPLIADYTGGTKSMSAALLAAALGVPGVTLQVMAGTRPDLVRVADGTERPFPIVPDFLLIERQTSLLRGAWKSFGYAEAAEGLLELERHLAARPDAPAGLVSRIADLRLLSEAFAAWDRFDHGAARDMLERLSFRHANWLARWMAALGLILDAQSGKAARLFDLWRNAERRAARGQYDDAVARCYRLIEATAQFLLETHRGFDTGNLDLAALPEDARR
ncbi:MAG: TIGR02710 family CRISPR-associated CARF protein, partial [Acetobacteraceae bacterium]